MKIQKLFKGNLYVILIKRLLIIYLLFSITRIIFYVFNYNSFRELSFSEFLKILIYGLRFDTSAILIFNSLFIFFSIIPFKFRINKWYQKVCKYIFIIVNSIILAANCVDIIYYRYTQKRTTYDIFDFVANENDVNNLIPQFLFDFWYIALFWIGLIVLIILLYNKTRVGYLCYEKQKETKYYYSQSFLFLLFIGLSIIGIRGGIQYKPINIINAGECADMQYVPIILNTPFTIIKTINEKGVKEINYFTDLNIAEKIFNPYHKIHNKDSSLFKKYNVVIIIFEGLSKEHIGCLNKDIEGGNYKGFTPFLDSLISESIVFDNAFANGKKSIEGIPAIIAGIPTLMNTPYISSIYACNKINSLPDLLKKKGYVTSFYHGGKNGTMRFDSFTKFVGIDNYYGKSEYNNDADYDGCWGIWDEEFLQYTAHELNKTRQPFFASVFTLSSHHPYKVPDKYKNNLIKGKLKIQQSIGYTDYALSRFFESISKMTWFDNTLFIITADHTSEGYYEQYVNRIGMYKIPIIFYMHNSKMKMVNHNVCQQIDIMPTILHYLDYNKDYIAFGTDMLDSTASHFSINFVNETYQLIEGDYVLIFDGSKSLSLYNWKNDQLLKKNVLKENSQIREKLEIKIKAIIQNYNERLMKNKLTIGLPLIRERKIVLLGKMQ